MKKLNIFKRIILLLPMMASAVLFQNCTEDIDTSSRYVFEGNTILSYLESHSDEYSQYIQLLNEVKISDMSESTVSQLMTARGNFTCFAPTNEAIDLYLQGLVEEGKISVASWDAPEFLADNKLLLEKKKQIVLNSIIDGGDNTTAYETSYFSERASNKELIGLPTMQDNKLQIMLTSESGLWETEEEKLQLMDISKYCVEGAPIDSKNCDIYTINGRIHKVHKVIAPSTETIAESFEKIIKEKTKGYYVFATLAKACGLFGTLSEKEDAEYYNKILKGELKDLANHNTEGNPGKLPSRRYIGFTIFAEPDEWWEQAIGISIDESTTEDQVVDAVREYVENNGLYKREGGVTGTDYTNTNNALNQFVTYHILPARIANDKLVIHYNELWYNPTDRQKQASVFDYYTTMGQRRLLKTYEARRPYGDSRTDVIWLNRVPKLDNKRTGNYTENGSPINPGVEILTQNVTKLYNGYIYPISDRLYFNEETADYLSSERIRIDASTFFKELMTNDIRDNENTDASYQTKGFPVDKDYRYLDECWINEGTRFFYLCGRKSKTSSWHNYQGDEINVIGKYQMTMKMPPVPKDGYYEIRYGASCSVQRGMCQVYFGTNKDALPAAGIPLDLRKGGEYWYLGSTTLDSGIGWEADDANDEQANIELDKKLRNNGFMKAPNSYYRIGESQPMRATSFIGRRIIVRQELKANETYYIKFMNVLENEGSQFYMDYIEYCPKSVYDNPTEPEDIW